MFATKNTEEKQNGYSIKQTSFRLRSRRDEITAFLDGRRKIERKAKRDCHKSCAIYIQLCRSGQEMFFGAENKPKLTCAKNGEKEKMFRQRSQSSVRKWSRNGKNIFFPSCCVSDPHYQSPRTHTQRGCSQKNTNFSMRRKEGEKGRPEKKEFQRWLRRDNFFFCRKQWLEIFLVLLHVSGFFSTALNSNRAKLFGLSGICTFCAAIFALALPWFRDNQGRCISVNLDFLHFLCGGLR